MKLVLASMLAFILLIPIITAAEYHIPLLAVRETSTGFEGSTADLYLEVTPGQGRVFLDTQPLTKLDTQISTRFAQEIACSETPYDCNSLDFFYTITSESPIVGGPSAGAATTALTVAALEQAPVTAGIAVTGTINSGGLVGPVGGVKEKIDAAISSGMHMVLVPKGEGLLEITDNSTYPSRLVIIEGNASYLNVTAYGEERNIDVVEVATLDEILFHLIGRPIPVLDMALVIDTKYQESMNQVRERLCTEADQKIGKAITTPEDQQILDRVENLTSRRDTAFAAGRMYSAASYCFSINTQLSYILAKQSGWDSTTITREATRVQQEIAKLEHDLGSQELETITDLETYMVVKERLTEAEDNLKQIAATSNSTERIAYVTYADERLKSAKLWSTFFGTGDDALHLSPSSVRDSCITKIYEAQERQEFLQLISSLPSSTNNDLAKAQEHLDREEYALCLFSASKAKAESDVVLSTVGVRDERVDDLIALKLDVIRKNLLKQQAQGVFPVVGYSYYEYAQDLQQYDKYSSLLFAEYSLELSNLDIYFDQPTSPWNERITRSMPYWAIPALLGCITGLVLGYTLARVSLKNKKKPRLKPARRRR